MTNIAPNSTASRLVEQVLNSRLEFVPARLSETAAIKPASYVVIRANTGDQEWGSSSNDSSSDRETDSASTTPASTPGEDASSDECKEVADNDAFYDINEKDDDRGSRTKSRIFKAWKYLTRPPLGLENQGVTCYMNAAIQAIFHTPAMAHYLNDVGTGKCKGKISDNSVSVELAMLYRRLCDPQAKRRSVYPARIIRRLNDINCMMSEWQQEDSHEYFMSLIGILQEDSVAKGHKLNTSIIHDIFGGNIDQRVTCNTCGHVSTTHQDFYDLPVSFSPVEARQAREAGEETTNFTLEGSIADFFSPETIKPDTNGKSGYQCEKCKNLTSAVKISRINQAPEYLAVHIKRFKFQGSSSQKLKDTMKYPLELSLTKYSVLGEPIMYKLISVIVHEGRTVSSGHYVALCRQPNNTWAEYDDEIVRKVPEKTALRQNSAYMLVYSRLTASSPKTKSSNVNSQVNIGINSPKRMESNKRPSLVDADKDIDAIFATGRKKTKVY
jgi:ubiquitin carboxyl-terminal hydrolase 10